ncbi:PIN domain-containing protein [Streptomyces sp. NPDC003943]
MSYLADTSAVWRLLRGKVGSPWPELTARGQVAICPPVEAELMRGLRSGRDHDPFFAHLNRAFTWVPAPDDPWPDVMEIQEELLRIGHHRGPSPMDILIALTAEQHQLTLVHVDDDFAAIAKVRPGLSVLRLDVA